MDVIPSSSWFVLELGVWCACMAYSIGGVPLRADIEFDISIKRCYLHLILHNTPEQFRVGYDLNGCRPLRLGLARFMSTDFLLLVFPPSLSFFIRTLLCKYSLFAVVHRWTVVIDCDLGSSAQLLKYEFPLFLANLAFVLSSEPLKSCPCHRASCSSRWFWRLVPSSGALLHSLETRHSTNYRTILSQVECRAHPRFIVAVAGAKFLSHLFCFYRNQCLRILKFLKDQAKLS